MSASRTRRQFAAIAPNESAARPRNEASESGRERADRGPQLGDHRAKSPRRSAEPTMPNSCSGNRAPSMPFGLTNDASDESSDHRGEAPHPRPCAGARARGRAGAAARPPGGCRRPRSPPRTGRAGSPTGAAAGRSRRRRGRRAARSDRAGAARKRAARSSRAPAAARGGWRRRAASAPSAATLEPRALAAASRSGRAPRAAADERELGDDHRGMAPRAVEPVRPSWKSQLMSIQRAPGVV